MSAAETAEWLGWVGFASVVTTALIQSYNPRRRTVMWLSWGLSLNGAIFWFCSGLLTSNSPLMALNFLLGLLAIVGLIRWKPAAVPKPGPLFEDPRLQADYERAMTVFHKQTPEEKEAMYQKQREGWGKSAGIRGPRQAYPVEKSEG